MNYFYVYNIYVRECPNMNGFIFSITMDNSVDAILTTVSFVSGTDINNEDRCDL